MDFLLFILGLVLGFAFRGAIARENQKVHNSVEKHLADAKAEEAKMREKMVAEYKLFLAAVRSEKAKVVNAVSTEVKKL